MIWTGVLDIVRKRNRGYRGSDGKRRGGAGTGCKRNEDQEDEDEGEGARGRGGRGGGGGVPGCCRRSYRTLLSERNVHFLSASESRGSSSTLGTVSPPAQPPAACSSILPPPPGSFERLPPAPPW
eukprot:617128-Hanusia_phi.AAC.1